MSEEKPSNQPQWQAESQFPELMEALRTSLREISDPEIGLNIIQLGLVRDVDVDNEGAVLTMILTTPFCPYGPALLETARQKAEAVLQKPTTIAFGNEAWDFALMEEGTGADWGIY
jgi:metal-sulfur cluster biosynthetic enzyme